MSESLNRIRSRIKSKVPRNKFLDKKSTTNYNELSKGLRGKINGRTSSRYKKLVSSSKKFGE